ncbi:hypothetical protein ACSMAE_000471 [Cronobacter sakazakii]
MKLMAIKPIYFEGKVLTEGTEFETLEQHGRELLKKGYAAAPSKKNTAEQPEQPEQPEQAEQTAAKKKQK